MPSNNISLSGIVEFFKNNDNFLLLCHKNPDADTLGSALALRKALKHIKKRANIVCAHAPSSNNAFLFDENEDITSYDGENVIPVSIDVASLSLLGSLENVFSGKIKLKIDHHATSDDFAEYNYTDADCGACGEIIFDLLKMLNVPLNIAAEPLYAAISSDTGGFRYSNTRVSTHLKAAELLSAGADNAYIDRMLFENRTRSQIRAINAAYSGLRYFYDGKVAVITITNEIKERLDLNEDDLGILSSLSREIDGVLLGLTLRQNKNEPTKYKLSARSEPGFPANELCAVFGGGGHACAAGAELDFPSVEKALNAVLSQIKYKNGILSLK